MDADSDESERWEDFFGSSTDLGPSLLGFYDTLTNALDGGLSSTHSVDRITLISGSAAAHHDEASFINEDSNYLSSDSPYSSKFESFKKCSITNSDLQCNNEGGFPQSQNLSPYTDSSGKSLRGSTETISSPNSTPSKYRTNLRVLSENVKRIIAHSDAEAVDAINIEHLQELPVEDTTITLRTFTNLNDNSHKLQQSIIPLSKTTGKLTQASTADLVKTLNTRYSENKDTQQKTDKKAINSKNPPTILAFGFVPEVQHDNHQVTGSPSVISLDEHNVERPSKVYSQATTPICLSKNLFASDDVVRKVPAENLPGVMEKSSPFSFDEELSLRQKNLSQAVNNSLVELDEQPEYVIHKPLISRNVTTRTTENRRTLSYSRSKVTAASVLQNNGSKNKNQADTITNSMQQQSADNHPADIKSNFSTKDPQKLNVISNKLKNHRPLSSSSICSTSSTSSSCSSGADHNSGKLNTSYPASVESLADHSENEHIETRVCMTVFERACMEIVDSERNYVNDLGEVIRGYLLDWKERACLHHNELQVLFSNIEDIYQFNQFLLKHLTESILDPLKIAQCFIDLKDGFDVYTRYCTSYPRAISLLTKLLQATHTNALLASTQRMLHHTLPLGSYLLKPVQRILKYHLLLDNLRKHCCDLQEVVQAYEIMRQVARNIDQVKRKLEQQTRVKELSGILDGWLGPELTVLGELRLEGILMENNKPRKVLLFATMLITAKAKEDNRLQFKSYIHQNNLMLSEHLAGEPTSFYVIPYDEPRNQIKLAAKNRDQKRLWTQHIKSVILEKFDNIPLRAKELVYQLGDEEDRTNDKSPWKWSLHSTSTPTYLERRNQFRRSEMRNHSKVKRKTIANDGASIDIFNEINKDTVNCLNSRSKSAESINDNTQPSLEQRGLVDIYNHCDCPRKGQFKCSCYASLDAKVVTLDSPKTRKNVNKSLKFGGGKPLKERSKSVPRINTKVDFLDRSGQQSASVVEKPLAKESSCHGPTTKSFPQRMSSTLKRQKSKVKQTSTFYMDLNEFADSSDTVLKITESSDNVLSANKHESSPPQSATEDLQQQQRPDVVETTEKITPSSEKAKLDGQIVFDLLKNSKEFDKLCYVLQKKRTIEKKRSSELQAPQAGTSEFPPRPPSRSPPPLEVESGECLKFKTKPKYNDEHIYETLLRNVHVPYKFSPVLGRSKSVVHIRKSNKEMCTAAARPDSDYVTLVYTSEGVLANIDNEEVRRSFSKTNNANEERLSISKEDCLNDSAMKTASMTNSMNGGDFHGPTNSSQTKYNVVTKGLLHRMRSNSTLASSEGRVPAHHEINLESRNIETERNSILHLQGSESIGERMAHVDYADPRTLFAISKRRIATKHLQRDSVFSISSSNDSCCESKSMDSGLLPPSEQIFNYEDSLDECLEADFRDSAIYSDDNERRHDNTLCCPLKTVGNNPPLKPKPLHVPPLQYKQSPNSICNQKLSPVICSSDMRPQSARSWVLQQIDNFSK